MILCAAQQTCVFTHRTSAFLYVHYLPVLLPIMISIYNAPRARCHATSRNVVRCSCVPFLVATEIIPCDIEQDVVISQLLSDVEAAEWKRGQMENSLLDEEQLAASLRDAIRGAHAEIAAINTEKIRLNQSWQSSLLALQKNHEALAAVHQSIRFVELLLFSSFFFKIQFFFHNSGTKKLAGKRSTDAGRSARKRRPSWLRNGPTSSWNWAVWNGK